MYTHNGYIIALFCSVCMFVDIIHYSINNRLRLVFPLIAQQIQQTYVRLQGICHILSLGHAICIKQQRCILGYITFLSFVWEITE